MRPRKIVSGGQTGADRGGLDAALELGIEHGGWCPRGRKAEDGRIPAKYLLTETSAHDYVTRTQLNAEETDATALFLLGSAGRGSLLTKRVVERCGRPLVVIQLATRDDVTAAEILGAWLEHVLPRTLNVAGNRESHAPGIQERTRAVIVLALQEGA